MYKINFVGTTKYILLSSQEMDDFVLKASENERWVWINKKMININNIAFINKVE